MIKIKSVPFIATMLTGMMGTNAFADTLSVNSVIQKVTIYKEGAMVERKATVKIPAGVTVVKIPMLSPLLDQKSLQIGVTNNDITLGNVNIDFEVADRQSLYAIDDSLTKKIVLLQDSLDLITALSNVLTQEKDLVQNNKDISGNKRLTAEQLSGVATFMRADLNDIADRQLAYSHQIKDCLQQQKGLEQEVSLLDERKMTPKGVIYVALVSKEPASTEINFNYRVNEAQWEPFYEIRLDKTGNTMLVKKEAIVSQSSKEDWNDVKLTVTKNSPNNNNEMPKLERYTLPYRNSSSSSSSSKKTVENEFVTVMGVIRDNRGPLEGTLVQCKRTHVTVQTDKNGNYKILIPNNSTLYFSHAGYKEVSENVRGKDVQIYNVTLGVDESKMYTKTMAIHGKVIDSGGSLPGASITVKEGSFGTETDDDGEFYIEAPVGSTLEIEFLGYDKTTYKVTKDMPSYITIKMAEDVMATSCLDIAAVPYGSTGPKKNKRETKASVDNALQGRVAGVQATPGSAATLRIHGVSSLSDNGAPLYVLDGMPIKAKELSSINPADIVSMEVLKDCSATAIYGSRASNGVIIIQTKQGSQNGSDLYNSTFAALQDYITEAHGLNSVPADGADHDTYLGEDTLKVKYSYYAAPKFSPNVYMLAKVPQWREHQLQKADVRVFIDNAFIGNTQWDPVLFYDTLSFSVCTEKDVAVERKLQTSLQSKNIINTNKKVQRDWLIVVKNNKETSIDLQLQDQIPVSESSDVKVALLNSSGAQVNESKGILTWNLHLAPNERKEIKVSYEVSVKKDDEDILEDIE